MTAEDPNQSDFCRVCRCEGTATRPLFHPCMCTGSIKYVHQDCLVRWLHYSKRHTCELCHHRFAFAPIYASGTPRFIPFRVLVTGLVRSARRSVLNWMHLVLVFLAWLIVVPLTACRIYRCLFTGSVSSLLTLPLDMLSTRHLLQDCLQGFSIVILASAAFLGYISLREQLIQGGRPAWLEQDAAAGNNGGDNGNHHMFPDLFNLFGAANGFADVGVAAGPGAPPAGVAEPALAPTSTVENRSENASFGQSSENNSDLSSSTSTEQNTSHNTEDLVLQPQQMGTLAEGLDQSNGWHRTNAEGDVDGAARESHGPFANEPDMDGAATDGDWPGVAEDAGEIGEAMNWDRLLGLDGSLAFLEHVLWLIALDTLFIVIFAFCPYHMGQFTVAGFKLEKLIEVTHMEGLSTGIIGYVIFAGALVLFHCIFRLLGMPNACYWTGLCYVYIKVALVSLLELGIFPILCGLWIDTCTLSLFNSTLTQRAAVLHHAPIAFTFIHWAMGMLYIFYMASLLILARGVVRPGVFRFVYHFVDPDFKPIQDMIMQPLHIYLQRLIATYSIWGILIVLMLWLPLEVIRRTIPGFLPYQINVAHESPLDYSVEIILIQVVLPFLLDAHAKATVRQWLRGWCVLVSWLLNIRSFLLGDVPLEPGDLIITEDGVEMPYNPPGTYGTYSVAPEQGQSFSTEQLWQEEHNSRPSEAAVPLPRPEVRPDQPHANAQQQPQHGPRGDEEGDEDLSRFMPYKRTSLFTLRLTGLLVIVLISLMLLSAILLVCPVGLGRLVFTLINVTGTQKHDAVALVTGFTLLGLLMRVASCLPALLRSVHRSLSAFLLWFSHLFCWSRRLHVLRIWTRSGTTCEIAIPRPALPAPVRTITSLSTSSNSATETGAENICPTAKFTRACAGRLYVVSRVTFQALRLGCVALILLVLLPVAIGLLVNLVFITPFQVAPRKTLIFGFWEHWIFGIMHLKVTVLITMASPSWWLRRRLEAVQNELITHRYNARSSRILSETAPLILIIGLSLAAPYLLSHYVWSWIYHYPEFSLRYLYPGTFGLVVAIFSCWFHIKQLQKLYVRIKDEKYLVGRRLVNCGSEEPGDDSQALTLSTNHAV